MLIRFMIIWIIWIKKLFLNKLVFVGRYFFGVMIYLLRLVEKLKFWFFVEFEIFMKSVLIVKVKVVWWVVFFLVEFLK